MDAALGREGSSAVAANLSDEPAQAVNNSNPAAKAQNTDRDNKLCCIILV